MLFLPVTIHPAMGSAGKVLVDTLFISFFTNRVQSVENDGSVYRKSVVVLSHFEERMPIFGEVMQVLVTQLRGYLFVLCPLVADYFDRHFHAYHVVPCSYRTLVHRHHEFHDHYVLDTN